MGRGTYEAVNRPFCLPPGVVTRTLLSQSKYKDHDGTHRWLGCGRGRGLRDRLRVLSAMK